MPHPRLSRSLSSTIAAVVLGAALVPAGATTVSATGGSSLVSIVNRYRAELALAGVALDAKVDQIAAERSDQLAAARTLNHNFEYLEARLAEEGVCWQQMGEIVAFNMTGHYEQFVSEWYQSEPHRAIMLDSVYSHAGGSVSRAADGGHYAVMVFVKLCAATALAPAPTISFTDIAHSPFRADIEWLVAAGITKGCASNLFCPTDAVGRDQMASFMRRALDLPPAGTDYFIDDWFSGHQDDINAIAAAGLTYGCAADRYCPSAPVSRDQMASFLARALRLPPAGADYFWDDNGSGHEDAINRVAAAGITNGCGPGRYCPSDVVTREQMAAFLHRALGS